MAGTARLSRDGMRARWLGGFAGREVVPSSVAPYRPGPSAARINFEPHGARSTALNHEPHTNDRAAARQRLPQLPRTGSVAVVVKRPLSLALSVSLVLALASTAE